MLLDAIASMHNTL